MADTDYGTAQMPSNSQAKGTYASDEIDARACAIVRGEKQRWEVATAFVTDRVSFKMRQLIRILRKNYYGIFDEPKDATTGLEKIWYPLTEINVEAVIKNIDLDQKDINFKAKGPNGYGLTDLTRAAVKNKLSKIYFGQKLDDFERMLAIDGTAVWKTYEEGGKMVVQQVDLLNIYIDPTTPSIQEAYRFTERALMFPEAIAGMSGWHNTKDIEENVVEGLPRTDPYWMNRASQVNSNVKMIDVYECWGKIPLSLITGRRKDDDQEVEGHIVISGIDSPGRERCHLIERNTKTDAEGNALKPYEECWFTKVPNRWYGRGVAEKLLTLQIYSNIVFNVRINRSRVSQLGLFKIRKGAGITPQMLSRLPSNGAVVLNSLDDLEQLEVQEVGATSYKDEDVINQLSERLTNAFEVATGEGLPSSTSATANAIQSQSAKTGFTLIKDQLGHFLERWMDRHALPLISKELSISDLIRIEADDDTYGELVDRVLLVLTSKALEEHYEQGFVPNPQELARAMDAARGRLSSGDLFFSLVKKMVSDELETQVFITNEEIDVAVTVQNLINLLSLAPEYRDDIVKQTYELMGLSQPQANRQPPQQPGQLGQQQAGPNGQPIAPQTAQSVAGPVANGQPAPQPILQIGRPGGAQGAATAGRQKQRQQTAAVTG